MASVRRTVTLPLGFLVCVLAVAGVAATPAVAAGKSLAAAAPQDASAVEASLALDRATRRLIQQGLRNQGFDPGTPDGLFGPRTRAAIREWQQSRGGSPTGYLNSADVKLLRAAPVPLPAVPQGWVLSGNRPAPTLTETGSNPARPTVATAEVNPQNAAETNTQQPTRAAAGTGTVQLPPEILVDRHLLRAERLLADGNPADALEEMNEILPLQRKHDLVLHDGFDFEYAQVAYAAGRTQTAIASANQYLAAAGRQGEFYREALELLDSAEVRLEREAAERRRAEAELRRAAADRRRAAHWPPGHVFRDCETCPEMVVLPGSTVALGRYEITVAEYRAFASTTGGGHASPCENVFGERVSDRDDYWNHSWRDPGFPQTDRHPVACVSWDDAQAYAFWLTATTEAPYHLPTWEQLAGAAQGSQPGCNRFQTDPRRDATCPVGTHGRNRLGLSDMLANVSEWTSRCSRGDCGRRWYHGGNWYLASFNLVPNFGNDRPTDYRGAGIGFRVARALE